MPRPTAAGVAGDGAGGRRFRLRGADRGVRRHLRPAAVGHHGLHAHGLGVRAGGRNPRIRGRARRPGHVGDRYVHQRGSGGLDRGRGPDRDLGSVLRGEQADYMVPSSAYPRACSSVSSPEPAAHRWRRPDHRARPGAVLTMPERNFRPSPREGRSSMQHAAATARGGVGWSAPGPSS